MSDFLNNKVYGDRGQQLCREFFESKGFTVYDATPDEDKKFGYDLIVVGYGKNGEEIRFTVDSKAFYGSHIISLTKTGLVYFNNPWRNSCEATYIYQFSYIIKEPDHLNCPLKAPSLMTQMAYKLQYVSSTYGVKQIQDYLDKIIWKNIGLNEENLMQFAENLLRPHLRENIGLFQHGTSIFLADKMLQAEYQKRINA